MSMRRDRGRVAALSGRMAEEAVARLYRARGAEVLASRWRGAAGEIDLICQDAGDIVFVEVKAAPTHAQAAERIAPHQMRRIAQAACEYCAKRGWGEVPMRFDAALVDGTGQVELVQNAFDGG